VSAVSAAEHPPPPVELAPRSPWTVRPGGARFEADCVEATIDAMRPSLLVLAALFLALAPINASTIPASARTWVTVHDLVLGGGFLALARLVGRGPLSVRGAAVIAVTVPLAILSNTILSAAVGGTSMPQVFVALILVGVGSLYLVRRWLLWTVSLVFVAWLIAILPLAPSLYDAGEHVMVSAGAAALGCIVHGQRRRAAWRVAQLRAHEVLRQAALEQALVAAEDARASLDRKVAERTAELAGARDAIASELAERQASVERQRALERSLAEAQRMESVGRLAGGVAHDFNNLLMVIGGNVELLLEDGQLGPEQRADLEEVVGAVERASRLIRQLLALGRRQVMKTKRTSVGELIDGVRKMVERVLGADIEFAIDVGDDLPIVVDPGQLEQVIMNLVLNARDAMPAGGRLTLRGARRDLVAPAAGDQPDVVPGAYAVLEVIDTGHGMDEQVRQSLFEPFFTTKPASRGSGLGLPAVRGIVAQHGGFIEVDSAPGRGSTFRVHLPLARGDDGAASEPVGGVTPGGGHERVLVVEDEPAVRRLAADGLARVGYRVTRMPDAESALRALEATAEPFDLMITDVIMPGMDGVQLADQVRARWPTTRVLFMSGYAGERLAARGLGNDDQHLLHKPFTLRDLIARVRAVLDQPAAAGHAPEPSAR
jgi:two-component system cell cycle sensor histidine kinase/response regulator CckA